MFAMLLESLHFCYLLNDKGQTARERAKWSVSLIDAADQARDLGRFREI